MKTLSILTRSAAVCALAASFGAVAPALAKVSDFDADGDKYVTMEEFHQGSQASFQARDTDQDGKMSRAEFEANFNNERDDFGQFDADGDGYLTNEELDMGFYGRYDQDGDGRLDVNETGEFDATIGAYHEPYNAETIIEDTDKLNIKSNN